MFETAIDVTSKELQARVGKFLFYDRILDNFLPILLLFAVLIPISINYVIELMGYSVPQNWTGVEVAIGGSFTYVLMKMLVRKRREYHVESDEWVRFYTYSIFVNLQNYDKTRSLGVKKSYRKKALKNCRNFVSSLEERWVIGNLKPILQLVGNSISDLKKNLRYRVIPAIKDGDEELLKQVSQIIYNFLISSRDLSIEGINEINRQMSERLPSKEPLKLGLLAKGAKLIKAHGALKHSLALITIGISSFIIGYIGWTYGVPVEYAWMGGIAIFVCFTGIYFQKYG
ncbi:MAG: hypothetical protein OEY22_02190 [Candidatus Bathyarchaeota archaeon]|nr:hypothetical protein [Candidatus Bathyarchaeota archaeon]MDH5744584.1 hypothetical protein [Candidatus Aminicenantes bacterium]